MHSLQWWHNLVMTPRRPAVNYRYQTIIGCRLRTAEVVCSNLLCNESFKVNLILNSTSRLAHSSGPHIHRTVCESYQLDTSQCNLFTQQQLDEMPGSLSLPMFSINS